MSKIIGTSNINRIDTGNETIIRKVSRKVKTDETPEVKETKTAIKPKELQRQSGTMIILL